MISSNLHIHYYSHFTNEEIKGQRDYVCGPRTQLESGRAGIELESVWLQGLCSLPRGKVLELGTMVTPPSGPKLTTYSPPQTLLLIPWPTECEFPIRHCSTCLISFVTVNLLLSHPSSYLSLSDPSFGHHQIKVRGLHCVTGRQCPSPTKAHQWLWVTYATEHQRTWWLLNRVPWWELKERASERVGQLHPYYKIAPCIVSFDQG